MRLLLAEDEKELSNALCAVLKHNNYSVDAVYNGTDALAYATADNYDGIIMDIMMPGMSGLDVLKEIRRKGNAIPVLLLTAKSELEDKVTGLDAGADDYLTKPFAMSELLARVRAMTRRITETAPTNELRFGDVSLDRASFELKGPKGNYRLGNKEYQMLEYMMQNPNMLISTERFMDKIWGVDSEADISVVWTYISFLRKKLAALEADVQINAKRNAGYTLEAKGD